MLLRKSEERETIFSTYEETRRQLDLLREMLASKLGIEVPSTNAGEAEVFSADAAPAPKEDAAESAASPATAVPEEGTGEARFGEGLRQSLAEVDGALNVWATDRVGELQRGLSGVSDVAQERILEMQQRLSDAGGKATELRAQALARLPDVGVKATELRAQALAGLPFRHLLQDRGVQDGPPIAAGQTSLR
jgi:hypothetical protein